MATRVNKPSAKGRSEPPDLEVLHPEQVVKIGERTVTVREYGFVEGMRLYPLYDPFLQELYDLMKQGEVPSAAVVQGVLASHMDEVIALVAKASDLEEDEVKKLPMRDGQKLMDAWWVANGPFFLRSVMNRVMEERVREKVRAGRTSTNSSLSTDTTRTGSANTPGDKSSSTSEPPVAPRTDKEAKPRSTPTKPSAAAKD